MNTALRPQIIGFLKKYKDEVSHAPLIADCCNTFQGVLTEDVEAIYHELFAAPKVEQKPDPKKSAEQSVAMCFGCSNDDCAWCKQHPENRPEPSVTPVIEPKIEQPIVPAPKQEPAISQRSAPVRRKARTRIGDYCPKHHLIDGDNAYEYRPGKYRCKQCDRDRSKKFSETNLSVGKIERETGVDWEEFQARCDQQGLDVWETLGELLKLPLELLQVDLDTLLKNLGITPKKQPVTVVKTEKQNLRDTIKLEGVAGIQLRMGKSVEATIKFIVFVYRLT